MGYNKIFIKELNLVILEQLTLCTPFFENVTAFAHFCVAFKGCC